MGFVIRDMKESLRNAAKRGMIETDALGLITYLCAPVSLLPITSSHKHAPSWRILPGCILGNSWKALKSFQSLKSHPHIHNKPFNSSWTYIHLYSVGWDLGMENTGLIPAAPACINSHLCPMSCHLHRGDSNSRAPVTALCGAVPQTCSRPVGFGCSASSSFSSFNPLSLYLTLLNHPPGQVVKESPTHINPE